LIAAALNRALVQAQAKAPYVKLAPEGVQYAAEWLSETLVRDNPRFDRERFLKAAGVQS
jgi:hypothetical protein